MPGGHTIQRITMPPRIFRGVDNINLPTHLHQKRRKKENLCQEHLHSCSHYLLLLSLYPAHKVITNLGLHTTSAAKFSPAIIWIWGPGRGGRGARLLTRPHQTVLDGPRFTVRPIFRIRRIVGPTLTIDMTRRGIVNFCSPCGWLQH